MAEATIVKEPFSWVKLFSGFGNIVGWTQSVVHGVRLVLVIVAVVAAVGLPMWAYHVVYTKGSVAGMEKMREIKDKEFKDWIATHPQNVVNGDNTQLNNNVTPKRESRFGLSLWPPFAGWPQCN